MTNPIETPYFWSAVSAFFAVFMFVYHFVRDKKSDFGNLFSKLQNITMCNAIHAESKVKCDARHSGMGIEGDAEKNDETAYRTRIGKEVDEHERRLTEGEKRFRKIEKCLIFLVEKQEPGAAAKMGLYE